MKGRSYVYRYTVGLKTGHMSECCSMGFQVRAACEEYVPLDQYKTGPDSHNKHALEHMSSTLSQDAAAVSRITL